MNGKALKYCEYIIRQFFSAASWPQEVTDDFHKWLLNGQHCKEKDYAMRRVFDELLEIPVEDTPELKVPEAVSSLRKIKTLSIDN